MSLLSLLFLSLSFSAIFGRPLDPSKDYDDPCTKLQSVKSQGIYFGSYVTALQCLDQFKIPLPLLQVQVDHIVKGFLPFYGYKDLAKDARDNDAIQLTPDGIPKYKVHSTKVNLEKELDELLVRLEDQGQKKTITNSKGETKDFKEISGFAAFSEIMRIFNKLGDAHTTFQVDFPQTPYRQRPYNIGIEMDETVSNVKPIVYFIPLPTEEYLTLTGDLSVYSWNQHDGEEIKTINGIDAFTYLLKECDLENFGTYKSNGTRLNSFLNHWTSYDFASRPLFHQIFPLPDIHYDLTGLSDENFTETIVFESGETLKSYFYAVGKTKDELSKQIMHDTIGVSPAFVDVFAIIQSMMENNSTYWLDRLAIWQRPVESYNELFGILNNLNETQEVRNFTNFQNQTMLQNLNAVKKDKTVDPPKIRNRRRQAIDDWIEVNIDDKPTPCPFTMFDGSTNFIPDSNFPDFCTNERMQSNCISFEMLTQSLEPGALYEGPLAFQGKGGNSNMVIFPDPVGYCYLTKDDLGEEAIVLKILSFDTLDEFMVRNWWNGTVAVAKDKGIKNVMLDTIGNGGGYVSFVYIFETLLNPQLEKTVNNICEPYTFMHNEMLSMYQSDFSNTFAEWETYLNEWPKTAEDLETAEKAAEELLHYMSILNPENDFYDTLSLAVELESELSDMSSVDTLDEGLGIWRNISTNSIFLYYSSIYRNVLMTYIPEEVSVTDNNTMEDVSEAMKVWGLKSFLASPFFNYVFEDEDNYSFNNSNYLDYLDDDHVQKNIYGGIEGKYGGASALSDCVLIANPTYWKDYPVSEYTFDKFIILTDGTCGSACSQLVSILQVNHHSKTVTVGVGGSADDDDPFDSSSFAGGYVESWDSMWPDLTLNTMTGLLFNSQAANLSWSGAPTDNLPTEILPLPIPYGTVNLNVATFALSKLGPRSLPREYMIIPSDVTLKYWNVTDQASKWTYEMTLNAAKNIFVTKD